MDGSLVVSLSNLLVENSEDPSASSLAIDGRSTSAMIAEDGDGNIWTIVQQPNASGGAVLKAPNGSRTNLPGTHETLATYDVVFGEEGSYIAYYLARGFDSSSDSFFTPDNFGVDPDTTENLASGGSFRWEIIFHQNASLSTGQLDAILQDLASCNPNTMGDFDGSGVIDFADFLTLSANIGLDAENHATGDIDCNGMVGFTDPYSLGQLR